MKFDFNVLSDLGEITVKPYEKRVLRIRNTMPTRFYIIAS